jgi:hypothetical protein
MMIVKININERTIEEVTAHNQGGDMNGLCLYHIVSKTFGELGYITHDRNDGAYTLTKMIMEMLIDKAGERDD